MPADPKFPRGARPTPRHILAAAEPFRAPPTLLAPTKFAAIPRQLSMWCNGPEGNFPVSGDCVSAEEAFAKAVWSVMMGLDELFVPPLEVARWAKKYGYWNGATLTDVMDTMKNDGFTVNGVNYHDGPYQVVDYSNPDLLKAAIMTGPVKIGLDANALPSGAGNVQGWYATGGNPGEYQSEDHSTGFCAFGSATDVYQALFDAGLTKTNAVPSGLDPTTDGFGFFTWSTVGFVDHPWIMSTVGETWVRNPTTPEQVGPPVPPPPPGPPVPPPPPSPPVTTGSVTIPDQVLSIPGIFGMTHNVTWKGGTYPVAFGTSTIPITAINWQAIFAAVAADIAAGKSLSQIIADVMAIIFSNQASTATGKALLAIKPGLTPQQWQAIIQAILQLLPIFFGS